LRVSQNVQEVIKSDAAEYHTRHRAARAGPDIVQSEKQEAQHVWPLPFSTELHLNPTNEARVQSNAQSRSDAAAFAREAISCLLGLFH
jgi:hypothetical protein